MCNGQACFCVPGRHANLLRVALVSADPIQWHPAECWSKGVARVLEPVPRSGRRHFGTTPKMALVPLAHRFKNWCYPAAFADGVLSLKATQSAQGVFKMQASEMKFELNIFGVDSSRFDQSVESLVPEQDSLTNPPGVLYESAGAFDGEDRFDNGANDGFSPRQAESDFRESVPFPRGRVDELDNDLGR